MFFYPNYDTDTDTSNQKWLSLDIYNSFDKIDIYNSNHWKLEAKHKIECANWKKAAKIVKLCTKNMSVMYIVDLHGWFD